MALYQMQEAITEFISLKGSRYLWKEPAITIFKSLWKNLRRMMLKCRLQHNHGYPESFYINNTEQGHYIQH